MSGGVDSSVAAHLLLRRFDAAGDDDVPATEGDVGVDVIGLHMSNWNALDEDSDRDEDDGAKVRRRGKRGKESSTSISRKSSSGGTFCEASEREYDDARAVARHLSIPLHRVSFASEYWIRVFEPFVESLSSSCMADGSDGHANNAGQFTTPNPDVGCNAYIKFGAMKEYAMNKLRADYVATGHYAQLWHRDYLSHDTTHAAKNCDRRSRRDFHEWMKETSRLLEQKVRKAIAGRPEEEWILNNHPRSHDHSHPPMLLAGADRTKDQSYFLSGVKGEAFRNVVFPLGHLKKSRVADSSRDDRPSSVRDIARESKLPTASKRDSMGICFVGKRNFGKFVSQYLPRSPVPGNFVDVDTGEIVGRHEGAIRYTVGQGAKISGAGVRYFVCGKGGVAEDPTTVFVCDGTHHPALYADELFVDVDSFNWIGLGESHPEGNPLERIPRPLVEGDSIELLARTRHLQPLARCTVAWERSVDDDGDAASRGKLRVRFDRPMRAITPGQIVALYAGSDGLICLGGGPIKERGASFMEQGREVTPSMAHPSGHDDLSVLRNL